MATDTDTGISVKVYANSGTKLYKNGGSEADFFFTSYDRFIKLSLQKDDYISVTPPVSTASDNDIVVENINDFAINVKNASEKKTSQINAKSKKTIRAMKSDKISVLKGEISSNEADEKPKPKSDNTTKTIYEISGPKGTYLYKNGNKQASIYFDMPQTDSMYIKDSLGTESYISIGPKDEDTSLEIKNSNSFSIIATEVNAKGFINKRIKLSAGSTHALKFTRSNKFYISRGSDEYTEKLVDLFLGKANDAENKGCHLDLEDLLLMCDFAVNCEIAKQDKTPKIAKLEIGTEGKKRSAFAQPGSWKPLEDWELHHLYIQEICKPQTVVDIRGPEEKKEDLGPLEDRELIVVVSDFGPKPDSVVGFFSQVFFQLRRGGHWLLYQEWRDLSYKKVRITEQAPKLDDIKIEDAPKQEQAIKPIPPINLHRIVYEVINTMGAYNYDQTLGRLQSDQIIELYQRAYHPKTSDRVFWYPYTDYERRSPFNYRAIKQNSEKNNSQQNPEPRVAGTVAAAGVSVLTGLFYVGRIIGSTVQAVTPLAIAALFGAPQKCQ